MTKQISTFTFGRSINALVEHLVEMVAEDKQTSDPETIWHGVMEIAAVLATQYVDPRAQRGYLEMISDALNIHAGSTV